MVYSVKEIYYTLQGEGNHTGRPAVFCRFTGCNLWTGHEKDRADAVCRFCDTDFVGTNGVSGGKFSNPEALAKKVFKKWPSTNKGKPYLVCTGGEPLLQLDEALIREFKDCGFTIAVETNGSLPAPKGLDWVCVSPKANFPLKIKSGDELKLIYPQEGVNPHFFETLDFSHFYLQPMDNSDLVKNTKKTINYCLKNPIWRLSIQTHKIVNID